MTDSGGAFEIRIVTEGDVGVLEWPAQVGSEAVEGTVSQIADEALKLGGLRRLEAVRPADDRVGRRALQRAGFRREGRRRQVVPLGDGQYGDLIVYGRLASDPVHGPGGFTGVMNSVLPRKRLIAHALLTDPWDRVCLLETTFKSDWELPGGIVNPHESPLDGVHREIDEELSVAVNIGRILVVDWLAPHLGWDDAVELIFDGGIVDQAIIDAITPDAREIRAVHWLTPDQAADRMAPFARGRLLSAVAGRTTSGTQYLERGVQRRSDG